MSQVAGTVVHVLVGPHEPFGRQGRSGGADTPNRGEVESLVGVETGLQTTMNEWRARSEVRSAGVMGKAPQAVEVGIGWVAVEKLDRRIDQQTAYEKIPHHPARRRVPKEFVVLAQIHVKRRVS